MRETKDYYEILQVHHLAEPDVIEGAFKKLAKKYHPDVNPSGGSEQTMKEINTAYQVLSDPVKRQEYHKKWLARHPVAPEPAPSFSGQELKVAQARKVLEDYFQSITDRDFDGAYRLISENDKANVSREDFIIWQTEVAKVFELKKFRCEPVKFARNQSLCGCFYSEVVEFQTVTVEKNIVMDRAENDRFIKKVVLDKGNWRVFLGYEELQPFIEKFQKLAELIAAKSAIQDLIETRGKSDPLTGLLNLRGFLEQAEKEVSRHQRYGNVFTVIRCELAFRGQAAKPEKTKGCTERFGKLLAANLRQLDIIGRTDEQSFTILLPETKLGSGLRVAEKIRQLVLAGLNRRTQDPEVGIHVGVVEVNSSTVTEILRQTDHCLNLAKRSGFNRIASRKGVY